MSLYLVTGLPGSGKSTVNAELKRRGYESYDGDEDHLAKWHNDATGLPVEAKLEDCTPEFISTHSRNIARATVEELAAGARHKPVFLCNDPENEEELQDLFTKVFALVLDDETLKRRIAIRSNNGWGKSPHHLEYSFALKQKWQDNCTKFGYVMLNAAQTPQKLADQILGALN